MIIKLLVFAVIGLLVWRMLSGIDRGRLRTRLRRWALPLLALALVVLALSGHLSWLVAAIVSLAAGLRRALPWILRYWPALASFAKSRRDGSGPRSSPGHGGKTGRVTAGMDRDEALAILGLDGTPSREAIVQAHRRLMQRNHPDRGGSDYLASRINEARDVLLDELPD